jgi:hypothetical protein
MERVWIIVACLCLVVAAFFLWRWNLDRAFVTGALGLVAWFLSLRSRLDKANLARAEASNLEDNDDTGEQDED